MPRAMHNKAKIQGHELEIQGILDTLDTQNSNVDERAPRPAPIYSIGTATVSASGSGTFLVPPRSSCAEC
jgi:hypothetical protein